MIPVLFQIGSFKIGSYGVMMVVAFLTCLWLLRRELVKNQFNGDWAFTIVTAAAIGGIIGARLYLILENLHDFLLDPSGMIFSRSGLTWYGGFIGGFIAVVWTIHRFQASDLRIVDLVAPLLILGYGIGRIGCLLAGDGDYGPPSNLPWAMSFPHGMIPTDVPVHPTPIYETLLSLLLFTVLWRLRKRNHIPGLMLGGMLIFYGLERFTTEFWRITPKVLWGWLSAAQILSVFAILFGLIWSVYSIRKRRTGADGE